MTGTLNKNDVNYRVTVTYTDGTSLSFGVEYLGEVLEAAHERRPHRQRAAYFIIIEPGITPTILAGGTDTLISQVRGI